MRAGEASPLLVGSIFAYYCLSLVGIATGHKTAVRYGDRQHT